MPDMRRTYQQTDRYTVHGVPHDRLRWLRRNPWPVPSMQGREFLGPVLALDLRRMTPRPKDIDALRVEAAKLGVLDDADLARCFAAYPPFPGPLRDALERRITERLQQERLARLITFRPPGAL